MKPSYLWPLLAAATPASARTVTDGQLWLDLSASGSLSGRLQGMVQVQPRFRDEARETQQLLGRVGLGWKVDAGLALWVGYTHTELPIDHAPDVNEERIHEQASYVLGEGLGGIWSGRTRLEQRWRSNAGGTGWRLRQQFRYVRRLAAGGTPYLALTLEPMIELADTAWGARRGLDQFRGFVGIGLAVGRSTMLETGYLNQVVNRRHGEIAVNHAAVLSLAYGF